MVCLKKSDLILGALVALGVYAVLSKSSQSPEHQILQAAQSDTQVGAFAMGDTGTSLNQTVAWNILNAPNAKAALALGNASLQGLDLTNPASVAVYSPPVSTGAGTFDAKSAAAVVASMHEQVALPTNPWSPPLNNAYPAFINNTYVANPNQLENLSHQWDLAHDRALYGG